MFGKQVKAHEGIFVVPKEVDDDDKYQEALKFGIAQEFTRERKYNRGEDEEQQGVSKREAGGKGSRVN
jgi:hypothetical protein